MSLIGYIYDSPVDYDNPQQYDPVSPPSAQQIPSIPHLMVPMTLSSDGSFAIVEQDSTEDVIQSIEMLCGSVQGERSVVPTYGLPQTSFSPPNPQTLIAAAQLWEPRATLEVSTTSNSAGQTDIQVSVQLVRGSPT